MPPKTRAHSEALDDKASTFNWTEQAVGIAIGQWVEGTRREERVDNGGFKPVVLTRIINDFRAQGLSPPSAAQVKSKKAVV